TGTGAVTGFATTGTGGTAGTMLVFFSGMAGGSASARGVCRLTTGAGALANPANRPLYCFAGGAYGVAATGACTTVEGSTGAETRRGATVWTGCAGVARLMISDRLRPIGAATGWAMGRCET